MQKDEMMKIVKEMLLTRLDDGDFGIQLCELVWEKLYPDGTGALNDEEDAKACKVFDECLSELSKKIRTALEGRLGLTLKEAILKHFGPGGQFFSPEATSFACSDDEMMDIPSDSCCGAGILALVWQAANTAQYHDGSAHQAVWSNTIEEAKVIYYG